MPAYSINGELVKESEAKVSVLDRGLLYGDGIFEGIKMYNGYIFKLKEHMTRLYESAKLIGMDMGVSEDKFTEEVLKTAAAAEESSAYVRITVSRMGNLGLHTLLDTITVTRMIIVIPLAYQSTEAYDKGLHLTNVSMARIPEISLPMRAKTLGYLNNILAVNEAKKNGADDALLLNTDGNVAESTGSNIFYIKGDVLVTPSPDAGILIGVTRNCIMEIAKNMGFNVLEKLFKQDELIQADEVFLTGTAMEIMPVYKINDTLISGGKPGEKTKSLMKSFKEHITEFPGAKAK